MRRLFIILLLLIGVMSGCYDNHKESTPKEFNEFGNYNIAQLRGLCQRGCHTITLDLKSIGYITSSDKEGNFYRSVIVEDGSGAVEIKLGTYNIESQYPIGLMVALNLKGTAVMVENGVVQLGLPPQSFDSSPREMEATEIIDQYLIRSNEIVSVVPTPCNIKHLDITLCGRFISIDNLSYAPLADQEEEVSMTGYHRFVDNEGNAIYVYTSPYANFANMEIPNHIETLQGILYYEKVGKGGKEHFIIKPRFADDISTTSNSI